jgi:hypothetical protein
MTRKIFAITALLSAAGVLVSVPVATPAVAW